jgi:Protein of unknown function (DUF3108)
MSLKAMIGIGTLVAVGCAAGAFYWVHGRNEQPFPQVVSAEPPGFHEAPSTNPTSTPGAKPSAEADGKKLLAPGEAELPLRNGEVLDYVANVANLNNVATLTLKIAGKGNFSGKSAWHLQAIAHTQNPLRMVFELDDQFDSYSEAATMASLQYEMHLSERGQKVESVQRMTATGKEPAPPDATEARVLPGTRDPLGMMQYLRTIDWSKTPEVRGPVYDGHKLYEAHATVQGTEDISVPAGSYRASKIAIRVFDNGAELKDASFALYLAQNDVRTPVLLEAVMPFANARVELTKARTGE